MLLVFLFEVFLNLSSYRKGNKRRVVYSISSSLGPLHMLTTWCCITLLSWAVCLLTVSHILSPRLLFSCVQQQQSSNLHKINSVTLFKWYFWCCRARAIVHIIVSFFLSPLPCSPNDMSEEDCLFRFLCMATEN